MSLIDRVTDVVRNVDTREGWAAAQLDIEHEKAVEAMWWAAQHAADEGRRGVALTFARLGFLFLPMTSDEVDDVIRQGATIR